MKKFITIVSLLLTNIVAAQDFIRVGGAFGLGEESNDIVQSITFDLNRTKAKRETDQNIYFLYTPKHYYILPVIDINLGENIKVSENNIKSAFRFGKNFCINKNKNTYYFINLEPTYNSDKDFSEKLYYANINAGFKFYKDNETEKVVNLNGSDEKFIIRENELSLTMGILNKIGERDSKTYNKRNQYLLTGGFLEFTFTFNKNNLKELIETAKNTKQKFTRSDLKQYANWTIIIKPRLLSIIGDLEEVTNNNSTGFIDTSIEKYINKNISFSLNYKFGNDQPKYDEVNVLEFGFKYKFKESK